MKTISKIAAIALVAVAVVGVNTASAATVAELQAMIAQLTAQISALSGTPSTPAAVTFTSNLTVGSRGAEVTALQNFLIKEGYNTLATGYFGPMTKAALAAYQTNKAITPAVGYFGPLTRAAVNAQVAVVLPVTPGTTTAPGLQGGAGSISVTAKTTYANEDVVANEKDAKVLAFEAEADNGSDLKVNSIKVELAQVTPADSDRIEDYIETVSVWYNGSKVGEANAEDFSESSDIYTKSISLKDTIIKAGDAKLITIAVTAKSNLDSGDIDTDSFTVDVLNVRYEDADGVVSTLDTDGSTLDRTFDFEDLSTSGDLEAKFSKSAASPEEGVIKVSSTADTNNVSLLEVKMKAVGSDMVIDNLEFDIAPVGASTTAIVKEFKLLANGVEIDSITPSNFDGATSTIEFTDLEDELSVNEGDTVTLKVVADINDLEGTDFVNGDSIKISLTSANIADTTNVVIEDENGDTVAAGDRTGSVVGETQTFFEDGIMVKLVGTPTAVKTLGDASATTPTSDSGDFTITFDVTAFGNDVYVDKTAPDVDGGATESDLATSTGAVGTLLASITSPTSATEGTYGYLVEEDTTERFTVTVNLLATASGYADVALTNVLYALTDVDGDTLYSANMDDFKTGQIYLNDR